MTTPAITRPTCPNCKKEMREIREDNISYLVCMRCLGLFISNSDLKKYVSAASGKEPRSISVFARDDLLHEVEIYNPDRHCPVCGQTMKQYQYCFNSGIKIDGCVNGHGVFLDIGELGRVRSFYMEGKRSPTIKENALIKHTKALVDNYDRYNSSTDGTSMNVRSLFEDILHQMLIRMRVGNELE